MLDRKPSTKLHEVVDYSYRFPLVVHAGPKLKCLDWYEAQPARKRQNMVVRVAGR